MYAIVNPRALLRARRGGALRVGRTVVLLGICSLLTDVSSEMVATVLPLYLVATLGFSPLQYGVVDGLYQGASALARLAAGFAGDRLHRHQPVAALGYGLSAICKLGLIAAGSALGWLSAVILVDRAGKGIRTAPRDAMISLSAPAGRIGVAFGVHRAMDSAGAMIGPLIAFGMLAAAPAAFHSVFLVSFFIALLGLGVITLLVREPEPATPADAAAAVERPDLRAAVRLLRRPPFRALTLTSSVLGLATISDAFVYLLLLDRVDLDPKLFPLLATGTATAYMLLAVPAGRIADRFGRIRTFMGGYVLLLGVYALLLVVSIGTVGVIAVLLLLGAYYAATDGVLAAMASVHLPETLRGSGLALIGTATSTARLFASLAFGALWTWAGIEAAVTAFGVTLVVSIAISTAGLRAAHV